MYKKAFYALLAGSLLFTSCRKDDDDDNNDTNAFPQELVIDGTRHELGFAFMESYADFGNNSHNLDLLLLTDDLTIHYDASNYPDSVSGNGHILYFELFSTDSTFLSAGTYGFDTNYAAGTYSSAFLAPVVNGEVSDPDQLQSGTVEVVLNDNVYTITGSGKDSILGDFNFSYQGAITIY